MAARPALRLLWRYRVVIAGVSALALALAGEGLSRIATPGAASNPGPEPGAYFVLAGALLVGLVAWVNQGWRVASVPAASAPASPASSQQPTAAVSLFHLYAGRFTELRSRLGWIGLAVGGIVVLGLAAWLGLLLRQSFNNVLAPWVWLALMLAFAFTFFGVLPWPWPGAPSLLTHDPAEPAHEPAVSRAEWITVGLIMLVTIALRFWRLDSIPAGPYIDEAGRALNARAINTGGLFNHGQFIFFGTGWWGVPSLYFWLEAQSLKLFGDNLLGARVVHALAGVGTVWFTYRTGRIAWSPRAGLLAAALIAASDFAIQFSRTAGESTVTIFTWTVCFYYLYKGLKSRRPLDFILSGFALGFTLYGYASGKLLPVFIALIALYLLVRWRKEGVKRYAVGFALMALAAGVVFAPNGLFILTQNPGALTERSQGVSIFSPQNRAALVKSYGTDNWGVILAGQLELTYAAFDVGQEKGPFYPTGQPLLPVPWAALWVLGTAYVVWRLWDARYGVLAGWLLSGLAGAALTNDTPTMQRVAGMVPLLGLIPALYLDRLASGLFPARWVWQPRLPARARLLRWAANGMLAVLVLYLGAQTVAYYFGPYASMQKYIEYTLAGRYAQKLDPQSNILYTADLPTLLGDPSPFIFLAGSIPQEQFGNPSDLLPITDNGGKNVHFLISDYDKEFLSIVKSYYPGGATTVVNAPNGAQVFTAYTVSADQMDERRQVAARYGSPSGPLFERFEPRLGTLGPPGVEAIPLPAWITYPTTAEWYGGLVVPAYATYRLSLSAPAGTTLEIDGRTLMTAGVGSNVAAQARVVLAKGTHEVRLRGVLNNAQSRVDLSWGAENGSLIPIGRQFLWNGPLGSMLGTSYPASGDSSWLTAPQLPASNLTPIQVRRDALLAWKNINASLGGGTFTFSDWQGKFNVTTAGAYQFDATGSGRMTVWVDGTLVGARSLNADLPPFPGTIVLAPGQHTLEVRYETTQDNAQLELFWQPPGGQRELLPSYILAPADGGVWLADERPGVRGPEGSLLNPVGSVTARVVGVISGSWPKPLGLAALPDGRVALGENDSRRFLIYAPDGRQVASDGSGSAPPEGFNEISDVAVGPDGTIAVLDAENADIRLYNGDGRMISRLSRAQLGLSHSRGIAWGPNSNIYVADTAGSQVIVFNRDGRTQNVYKNGSGSIQALDQPIDVAVAPDGSFYVVDLRARVVHFTAQGQADAEWSLPIGTSRGGSHLALWGKWVALTNPDTNVVTLLDPAQGALSSLEGTPSSPLNLAAPTGIAAGPGGRLYVLNSGGNNVVVLQATK